MGRVDLRILNPMLLVTATDDEADFSVENVIHG